MNLFDTFLLGVYGIFTLTYMAIITFTDIVTCGYFSRKLIIEIFRFCSTMTHVFRRDIFLSNTTGIIPDMGDLIIPNHQSIWEMPIQWHISTSQNRLIGCAFKKQMLKIPFFGYLLGRSGWPAISRTDAAADIKTLSQYCGDPFYIYAEGTRYTDAGYLKAIQFGKDHDIQVAKYTMIPKTTGAFNALRPGSTQAIYIQTNVYCNADNTLSRDPFPKNSYIRWDRYLVSEIPSDNKGFQTWLRTKFLDMDTVFDNVLAGNVSNYVKI